MKWLIDHWQLSVFVVAMLIAAGGWITYAEDTHIKTRSIYSYLEKQKSCEQICDELDLKGMLQDIDYDECVRLCRRPREKDED
jgi:hypothetical protein